MSYARRLLTALPKGAGNFETLPYEDYRALRLRPYYYRGLYMDADGQKAV